MSNFLSELSRYPTLYLPIFGIVGLLVGSFLNVVIYRLPKMVAASWREEALDYLEIREEPSARFNLAVPCSTCTTCDRAIRPLENIPILSYVVLRGRCAGCSQRVSLRYPLVELLGAGAGLLAGWHFGLSLEGVVMACLFWSLIALAWIDHDTLLLPDAICLPVLWAGLLFVALTSPALLADHVIGAAVGYLAFRLLPIGQGDAKLAAACGAWLGWAALPFFMSSAAVFACVVGLVLYVRNRESRPYPFGPSLAVGFALAVFLGHPYAQFLGIV